MYSIPFFSPMRYAAAEGREMKSPSNRNIPTQTGDVIVNPENPDSKPIFAIIFNLKHVEEKTMRASPLRGYPD